MESQDIIRELSKYIELGEDDLAVSVIATKTGHFNIFYDAMLNLDHTHFSAACHYGRSVVVAEFLKPEVLPRIDIYAKDSEGVSALDRAVMSNKKDVVGLLLNHQCVSSMLMGWEPVHEAFARGQEDGYLESPARSVPTLGGISPLYIACALGHLDLVRKCLAHPELFIHCLDRSGRSFFEAACMGNHYEVVDALMEGGLMPSSYLFTDVFTLVCLNGWSKLLEVMLRDKNLNPDRGGFPLLAACQAPDETCLHLLLSTKKVRFHHTPYLHLAVANGNVKIISRLLQEEGLNVNDPGQYGTPFALACKIGDIEVIKLLLDHPRMDFDLKDEMYISFVQAMLSDFRFKKDKIQILKFLRSHPASHHLVSNGKLLNFICALSDPFVEDKREEFVLLVKWLLECREIDPNKAYDTWTPLMCAARSGFEGVVEALLADSRVDPNSSPDSFFDTTQAEDTPLCIAVRMGHASIVCSLLNHPSIDVNKCNPFLQIMHGIYPDDKLTTLELLLNDPRVEVNSVNNFGETVFALACRKGFVGVVKKLLDYPRVDVNKADKYDSTPFSNASLGRRPEVIQLLLAAKDKEINYNASNGKAYRQACLNGDLEILKIMLSDPRIKTDIIDSQGHLPLRHVVYSGKDDAIRLILAMDSSSRKTKYINACIQYTKQFPAFKFLSSLLADFRENKKSRLLDYYSLFELTIPYAAQVLALIVLLCEEYLQITNKNKRASSFYKLNSGKKFFQIASRLPLELQTRLSNLLYHRNSFIISSSIFEINLKKILAFVLIKQ